MIPSGPSPARAMVMVVPDLMTATRIDAAARALGIEVIAAKSEEALHICRARGPESIVIDLEASPDPAALIHALKHDPQAREVRVLAFYPHVRNALRTSALAAGADRVLPRSAFFPKLAEWLRGEGHTPGPR